MAVLDQVANDQVMGTGSYKRGVSATVYRPGLDAGWGVMTGLAEPTAVRSHYPDPKTTAAIVARAAELRGHGVIGDPDVGGARDVLADVIRVWVYVGRPGVQWERLAELLADHQPDAYAGVTGESVSALVRDQGVPSVDVKAADGTVRKGCRLAAIEAAVERRAIESARREIGPGVG
jgi:S-DNA-T family DNA segregation ATPase FtsK/SpoIIIE